MSFRSQNVESHPVRGLWGRGVFLVTSGAWRLLRVQRTLSYCWVSPVALVLAYNQFRIFISALKVSMLIDCNLIVCETVWQRLDGICKSATTENWSEIKSKIDTERTLHPVEQIIRSRESLWMWVGKSTYWWRPKDSKIPDSYPGSNDEESIQRLKSPITAKSWGSVDT